MNYSFALIFWGMYYVSSYFQTQTKNIRSTSQLYVASKPNSYQQLREQAARIKAGESPNVVFAGQVPSRSQSNTQSSIVVVEEEEEANSNDLPFTDAMYDHFQYVISKITTRVKTGIPLTTTEIDRFEKSVTAIIQDSKKKVGLPVVKSAKPTNSVLPNKVSSDLSKKGEFDKLKGLSSTWEVEGMDSMTTEEYYAALNKRNIAINDERKKKAGPGYDRNPGDDYIEGLNKRNK